ncbi:MAG: NAD(P)-dependent oxidoreductase [Gammaproteobacteria bacterium]
MSKHKVAFIGLGVMGYPMAGHLARAGCDVRAHNRSAAKAEKWAREYGGAHAETPAAAAAEAEFVFACVGNDDDLRAVTIGDDGAFSAMKPGAVFIDHTTASARIARELAERAAAQNLSFLDAPISGGESGANAGALTVMAGGEQAAFDRARPLIMHFAKSVTRMGDAGAGQLTKMVNQICIAGLVQGLAEGVAFAVNAGLDARQVFATLSGGAAQSWQMVNRFETMIDNKFDFGFAVDWMRKDLGLCFSEAMRNGSDLPVSKIIDEYYAEIQAAGGHRHDTSSLLTRLRRKDLA